MLTFEEKLERYAQVLVRVGVNLQAGGKLHLDAPLEGAALARLIARTAYAAGAVDVDVRYADAQLTRLLYEAAPEAALDYVPAWNSEEALLQIADGYAFVGLAGDDPDLLAGLDGERVARRAKLSAQRKRPVTEQMGSFAVNWSVGAMAQPGWARKVFPELPQQAAVEKLWDAIFFVTRVEEPDPLEAWRVHLAALKARLEALNERRFAALHFLGPGTDLTVGLADGHRWAGGATTAKNGVSGVPNLPTDEVFTAPHRERTSGRVRATRPLSARGQLIEGIEVRFEDGRVVEARAARGEDTLHALLGTDEGARRLGEVALVAASAPVAQTGLLFYNTLFDENAASHIALGRAYPLNVEGGAEAAAQAGANDSLIHVDWMIGSPEVDVDGLTQGGGREPLMRGGEWAL